jgi:hypothetical protein
VFPLNGIAEKFRFAIKENLQSAAVWQIHAVAQPSLRAEAIEHAGNLPGILAEFSGFAFKSVNFFQDFYRYDNGIIFKTEE